MSPRSKNIEVQYCSISYVNAPAVSIKVDLLNVLTLIFGWTTGMSDKIPNKYRKLGEEPKNISKTLLIPNTSALVSFTIMAKTKQMMKLAM